MKKGDDHVDDDNDNEKEEEEEQEEEEEEGVARVALTGVRCISECVLSP